MKRPAAQRGTTELGWLHSRHSFSFGNYFDPDHMGFRGLRVINDDVVEPGQGFGEHPHRDAEIFSYVLEGELEHKDSMGNGRIIKAGDLQYISAGRGVLHSEFNPSGEIRANADVYVGKLDAGKRLVHRPPTGRGQWVHVIAGDLKVLGESLKPGDGLAIENAGELEFETQNGSQFLLFDLN